MPSSLETRMRSCLLRRRDETIANSLPHLRGKGSRSGGRGEEKCALESSRDPVAAAHIGFQSIGDQDRTVRLLIILQDRNQRASDRKARAVQRVRETSVLFAGGTIARIHAAGLEVAAIGA